MRLTLTPSFHVAAVAALALGNLAQTGRTTATSMKNFRRALRREDPECAAARLDAAAWKRLMRREKVARQVLSGGYGMPISLDRYFNPTRRYVPNYPINAARNYHLNALGV